MSAVSSIFHTMRGSGIEDALGQIFGPNVIEHILSGKAIARGLRVLYLLDACLTTKLLEQIIPPIKQHCDKNDNCEQCRPIQTKFDSSLSTNDFEALQKLQADVLESNVEICCEDIVNSEALQLLDKCIEELEHSSQSRTAKLWIQFLNYIGKIENFVASERLKDGNGLLQSCS